MDQVLLARLWGKVWKGVSAVERRQVDEVLLACLDGLLERKRVRQPERLRARGD